MNRVTGSFGKNPEGKHTGAPFPLNEVPSQALRAMESSSIAKMAGMNGRHIFGALLAAGQRVGGAGIVF